MRRNLEWMPTFIYLFYVLPIPTPLPRHRCTMIVASSLFFISLNLNHTLFLVSTQILDWEHKRYDLARGWKKLKTEIFLHNGTQLINGCLWAKLLTDRQGRLWGKLRNPSGWGVQWNYSLFSFCDDDNRMMTMIRGRMWRKDVGCGCSSVNKWWMQSLPGSGSDAKVKVSPWDEWIG